MLTLDDVLRAANNEVGYLEKASNRDLDSKTANAGGANYTKYARDLDAIKGWYNGPKQGFEWCAVFAEWCFVKAYGVDLAKQILPHTIYNAGCVEAQRAYASAGRLSIYPKVGDQIFFSGSSGKAVHTGLVVGVSNDKVTTIEGNTSSASGVVANGGCVRQKTYSRSYSRIAGYGHPNYDLLEVDKPMEERYNTVSELEKSAPWSVPTVKKLISKGYLSGDGAGLDLSRDMLRLLVINDRAGLYK